jgi:NAD(P)-dependent dehydrogenase (short-subunit alcohol dehydrogenase family)
MPDQINALIVGGTSGIGREIAHALARRGEEVIVTGATRHALKPLLPRSVVDIVASRSISQNPTKSSARSQQSGPSIT